MPAGVVGEEVGCAGWEVAVGVVCVDRCGERELAGVRCACVGLGGVARGAECWVEDADEEGDDGDGGEEFDEGEGGAVGMEGDLSAPLPPRLRRGDE